MEFGLKDKTALVLGGGGGLGRAISIALAGEGAKVAVADIDPKAIAETQAALASIGGNSIGLVWDLADLSLIDPHVKRIESELGSVGVLVNITGGPPPTPASGQDPALWTKHFQSMVLSVIAITDRVLPKMREKKWGFIAKPGFTIVAQQAGVVTGQNQVFVVIVIVVDPNCLAVGAGGQLGVFHEPASGVAVEHGALAGHYAQVGQAVVIEIAGSDELDVAQFLQAGVGCQGAPVAEQSYALGRPDNEVGASIGPQQSGDSTRTPAESIRQLLLAVYRSGQ